MPKGNPKPQTKASAKWEKKVGIIAKTYKLRKSLADEFAEVARARGSNPTRELSRIMQEYIDSWGGSSKNDNK